MIVMTVDVSHKKVKFMGLMSYQFVKLPINRLIHRSFTHFNFKILGFTNPVK